MKKVAANTWVCGSGSAESLETWGDLVVLGTHSRTGTSRFMIGSVAEAVVRKAPADILLIPSRGLPS